MSSTSGKLMFSLLIGRRRTCLRLTMYYLTLKKLLEKKTLIMNE